MAKSPPSSFIAQENHYYPFGLNLAGIEKEGMPDNKFQFQGVEKEEEFGLMWNETLFRGYDLQLGRWHQIDIKASERESPYVGMGNNPIALNDILGDTVRYANDKIQAYVEKYSTPRYNRKGKQVNRKYDPNFAAKIAALDKSTHVFEFTDDAGKLQNDSPGLVGQMNVESDGSKFNIVVPDHSGTTKADVEELMGGRDAVLYEETFHAFQVTEGKVEKNDNGNGTFGTRLKKGNLLYEIEAEAKIFAAESKAAKTTTTLNVVPDTVTAKTMAGLIRGTKNESNRLRAVGLLIGTRTTRSYQGSVTKKMHTVIYEKSY